jgi:predicted O-methyltransferase YrrM
MDFEPTQQSLDLVRQIASNVVTFHHHYHILYDIANSFDDKKINYVEIGAYAGGSSCLMLQRPNTTVISIDLGEPIPKEVVLENVIKYKTNNNNYKYIQGNSQVAETKNALMSALGEPGLGVMGYGPGIDILFIDGDHSFQGVVADFAIYSDLVNIGGYIVFDDYHDCIYSPEVKQAVDSLLPGLVDYEVLGTLENALGASPSDLEDGNCFVVKKVK